MKILNEITLIAATLFTAAIANASGARGYSASPAPQYRPNYGSSATTPVPVPAYVYRNPYAAPATVHVNEYTRSDGTVVLPHYRTPANETLTDNLNYRGNGLVPMLRSQPDLK